MPPLALFGTVLFHFRRSIKRPGSSLSDQFYKKIKRVNGRWCVGHSFLPSLHRKSVSEGAKESRRAVAVPPSQHLSIYTRRQREGRRLKSWLNVAWMLANPCRKVCPLEQRAGAFWGWRGGVRGAVAHGQYVIVAGDVAATGKVIGALGEAGGHSIGSLQDAHRWLCGDLGKKERGEK